jgi:hypothetical protein
VILCFFYFNTNWISGLFNSGWVETHHPPKWVVHSANKTWEHFCRKHGDSPYDQVAYFKGKRHRYKVHYQWAGQGHIDFIYYKKKR